MKKKRTEPLPSITDVVAAIEDLHQRHMRLALKVSSALMVIDSVDEADKPRAALIALGGLRELITDELK